MKTINLLQTKSHLHPRQPHTRLCFRRGRAGVQLKNKVFLNQVVTTIDCSECGYGVLMIKVKNANGKEIGEPKKVVLIQQ